MWRGVSDWNVLRVTRTAIGALLLWVIVIRVAIAQLPLPANGVITQPGLYYLQQDLLLTRDTGISIQANNVVLDLKGFDIRYAGVPHAGTFGIVATGRSNVRITDGTIGGYGYNVHASQIQGLQVDHMSFDDIPYIGINAATSYDVKIDDNTFSNFRYDIAKPTDPYLIGVNIGAEDAVISGNRFDAVFPGSNPTAPGVETVCVLFSADVSQRSVVTNNQMTANVPLDRSYGLWIASNAHVAAMHNTMANMRYGVTLASDAVGLVGYNDFSVDPPPTGVPALSSTFGVFAVSAKQVLATGNRFEGLTNPTYLPPNTTGDWNNTNMVLPLEIKNLSESLRLGVGYDAVEFAGTFTHGGSVTVDLSEFVPGPVGQLKVVGWAHESGNRSSTTVSFTGGVPIGYEVRSDGLYVTLTHTLLGDYNGDNQVDAGDYVLWRAEYGSQALYDTWRAHFGEIASHGTESGRAHTFNSSVAEPAVQPMGLLLALFVASWRRTRFAANRRHFEFAHKVLPLLLTLVIGLTSQRGLAERALAEAPQASSNRLGTVESRSVIFEDSHNDPYDRANYHGFNHAGSVTVLGGNRVMAVWFSGPFEGSVDQMIMGSISDDGGKTWGPAKVINDEPHVSDFDPAFINAGDRTFLFFSNGRWVSDPSLGPPKDGRPMVGVESFHILEKTTNDLGKSWSDPREVGSGPGWNCRSNGIKLSGGTLLLPTHHLKAPHTASVLLSSDAGRTWQRGPDIVGPGGVGAAEPSCAQLPDGKLVMVLRTTDGNLWLVRSSDRGRTWSTPEKQSLPAASSSASLLCTSTGKLVLTHNPTKPPLRDELTMRTSGDRGQTWSEPLLIAKIGPASDSETWSRQVSYPSVCELPDGALLVVWARITLSRENQSGAICSARIHLN
jgi:predicted neuraminidase